jgi:hypothetical protein
MNKTRGPPPPLFPLDWNVFFFLLMRYNELEIQRKVVWGAGA